MVMIIARAPRGSVPPALQPNPLTPHLKSLWRYVCKYVLRSFHSLLSPEIPSTCHKDTPFVVLDPSVVEASQLWVDDVFALTILHHPSRQDDYQLTESLSPANTATPVGSALTMVTITQERMDYVAHVALMPIALLINFSLCQYLAATYYARRREPRIILLLACAAIGFIAIIPFSHPDDTVFEYLDDVSETASTLTFLLQIVVIGRDVNKKMRIKTLLYMTYAAEAFVGLELVLILACIVKLADRQLEAEWINTSVHVVKDVALWFIFFSRFFYIAMARGFKKMVDSKRVEIGLYLLFATHEYPFYMFEAMTPGVSWQPVEALWNRLTLLFCLLYTVREKIRSSATSRNLKTGMSQGPHTKHSVGPHEKSRAPTTVHQRQLSKNGPSSRSILKIGISLRSVVPLGEPG